VRFVTYPKLLFIWPLILMGFVLWPLGKPAEPKVQIESTAPPAATQTAAGGEWTSDLGATVPHSDWLEVLAWIYIWTAFIVLLTLGVDVDRNQAIFWVVLIAAFWILGMWLQDRNYTIFGDIYRWFANLDIQYHRNFGLALSTLLLVPYLIMIVYARLNDRWRITHNEFEHYAFGKMDDSLGRGAKTIRSSFPDVLELILGMAGTLIVFNATGTRELRRIPHVMFLPLVRKRLDKILEKTAITGYFADEEEEEDEDG